MTIRIYYDPIHGEINLDSKNPEEEMIIRLIDCPAFQRLRRIKQLGPASLLFHGAESSRFTHSLGVFHIARKTLSKLKLIDQSIEKSKYILYGASLLHDIGHGPLSHTSEEIFNHNHEEWSKKLITEHEPILNILQDYQDNLPESIGEILINSTNKLSPINSLISSQLDCDRLDYMIRDTYNTGLKYGKVDIERIISALTITPDGDMAITPKGIIAVEHYFVMRDMMYRSVYNHRLNEISNWILEKIIKSARETKLKDIWIDKYFAELINNDNSMDINSFICNDDIRTYYHILRWGEDGPKQLSTLCRMFLDRDLLKGIDIKDFNYTDRLKILAIARQHTELNNLDPNIYCGIKSKQFQAYKKNDKSLRIWDGKCLMAIEDISPLVKSLQTLKESSWLIYPKIINKQITTEINNMKGIL
tara:strand:+ start:4711 stop:5967 length:1257 start_codon:yes stop_codon:yes gene_type:complete